MKKQILYCDNCGDEIGIGEKWPGEFISCGKRECDREARYAAEAEREEAHERLDRDMGWR